MGYWNGGRSKWHTRGWLSWCSFSEDTSVGYGVITEGAPSESTNFSPHRSAQLNLAIFSYYLPQTGHLISAC